jgi:hypothetical protein
MRRLHTSLAAGVLFVAFPAMLRGDDSRGPQPSGVRQYVIECWFDVFSSGKKSVVTAPKATINEGQPAMIRDIARVPRPGKTKEVEWLEEGTSIDVNVFRAEDGQRFLDAKLQCTGRAREEPEKENRAVGLAGLLPQWLSQPKTEKESDENRSIRLVTTSARIVEPLRLGEKVAVPIGRPPYEHRFEVRVSEVPADRLQTSSNGARDEGQLIMGGVTPRIIVSGEEEEKLGAPIPAP